MGTAASLRREYVCYGCFSLGLADINQASRLLARDKPLLVIRVLKSQFGAQLQLPLRFSTFSRWEKELICTQRKLSS
jgi:hypothetical protein